MRIAMPLLVTAMFVAGAAYAQPAGGPPPAAGTMPLQPNNCGTPDEPKPCPGPRGMRTHHAPQHATPPAQYHHPEPKTH